MKFTKRGHLALDAHALYNEQAKGTIPKLLSDAVSSKK